VKITANRTGLQSNPNDVIIVVLEHNDGLTICAVYPSRDDEPNVYGPGEDGRNRTRINTSRSCSTSPSSRVSIAPVTRSTVLSGRKEWMTVFRSERWTATSDSQ